MRPARNAETAGARALIAIAVLFALSAASAPATSQSITMPRLGALVQLSGEAEDRLRLAQLFDSSGTAEWLMRSASSLTAPIRGARGFAFELLAPELRLVYNTAIPFSINDGPLWAGRGANTMLTAGVAMQLGPVRAIIAPQFTSSRNGEFQVIPHPGNIDSTRNPWANAFHPWPSSIDLPFRFGDGPIQRVDPGQSSLTIDLPRTSVGVATENVWWGPAARNAIVLSSNAGGFPHAFARTRDGLQTRVGRFDAQWILGTLRESEFFDGDAANDARSLSGLIVAWSPRDDGAVSLGMARTVYAAAERDELPIGAALDFLRNVGQPVLDSTPAAAADAADQVLSLFGRWIMPRAGFEVYAEWARFEFPASLRDLLEYPQHSQGYTVGLQWAKPVVVRGSDARFRLHAEASYLEPDPAQRVRPVATTYTSRVVPQGYTHRGQSLGAAIGPGSSNQWAAADVFGATWSFGAFGERIRWDNATVWESIVPQAKAEDVSLIGGLRGGATWRGVRANLEFAHAVRLGFLYQDRVPKTDGLHTGVDIVNNTLTFTLSVAR